MTPDRRHRGLRRLAELHSRKAGEPPGTVVPPAAETAAAPVGMSVIAYGPGRHEARELEDAGEVASLHRSDAVTWLDIDGVHDVEALEAIGDAFELHPLTVEDIAHPGQRPKVEDYGEHLFLVLRMLTWDETPLVASETRTYLRDVADHTIQVVDLTTTFREMLTGMLDTYLSSVSNRMNEVMKVLTVVATIFIPLTFVVGIYGMNFEHMPELSVPWAYPAVWAVMVAIGGGMLVFFRRRGWI